MKLVRVLLVFAMTAASATAALAHEGHLHKLMGTVAAIRGEHLQIKATTGKTSEVVLNDKTKILRGAAVQRAADIKPGDRIVVTTAEAKDASGSEQLIAKEIRLGTSTMPGQ